MTTKTKTAKRTIAEERADNDRNVIYSALAKIAAKEQRRDGLADDSDTPVDITMYAETGGKSYHLRHTGRLLVAPRFQQATKGSIDMPALVAFLLENIGRKKRLELIDQLVDHQTNFAELPPVEPDMIDRAKKLLERLRATGSITKRGAVTFKREAAE